MTLSVADWRELFRHMADEINVKTISINDTIVHHDPLLADRYKKKQEQFDGIYGNKP